VVPVPADGPGVFDVLSDEPAGLDKIVTSDDDEVVLPAVLIDVDSVVACDDDVVSAALTEPELDSVALADVDETGLSGLLSVVDSVDVDSGLSIVVSVVELVSVVGSVDDDSVMLKSVVVSAEVDV
jgi:hypothetical protein